MRTCEPTHPNLSNMNTAIMKTVTYEILEHMLANTVMTSHSPAYCVVSDVSGRNRRNGTCLTAQVTKHSY